MKNLIEQWRNEAKRWESEKLKIEPWNEGRPAITGKAYAEASEKAFNQCAEQLEARLKNETDKNRNETL